MKDFTVSLGKHFDGGQAQEIKSHKKRKTCRNAKEKTLKWMVRERAKVEPAEKVTEVWANTACDECRKAEIARTKAFEGENGSRVS